MYTIFYKSLLEQEIIKRWQIDKLQNKKLAQYYNAKNNEKFKVKVIYKSESYIKNAENF